MPELPVAWLYLEMIMLAPIVCMFVEQSPPTIYATDLVQRVVYVMVKSLSSLVSVIIPTYNGRDTIERAIKGVMMQTYRNFELIIVDDGSTDSTNSILQKYACVSKLQKQKHAGPAAARNLGLRIARGKYVAFLDDDDTWIPEKLELQVEILEKHQSVGLTFGNLEVVDKWGKSQGFMIYSHECHVPSWQDLLVRLFRLPPSSTLIRKDLIDRIGGFDTDFKGPGYEDRDFNLRLREVTDFHFLDACLGLYCQDETHEFTYLANLPIFARKYWRHPRLQDPDAAVLRHDLISACASQLLSRMRKLLRIKRNLASYDMLRDLNTYHISLRQIFGDAYEKVSGLEPIDLEKMTLIGVFPTLLFLYLCRSDLQQSFPEVSSGDTSRLVEWSLRVANGEYPDSDGELLSTHKVELEKLKDLP